MRFDQLFNSFYNFILVKSIELKFNHWKNAFQHFHEIFFLEFHAVINLNFNYQKIYLRSLTQPSLKICILTISQV